MKCWAASLRTCSGSQSREHYVSQSILGRGAVTVSGLPWCKEPKTISSEALSKKALCTRHNADLAPLDSVAADALKCISRVAQVAAVRHAEKRQQAKVMRYNVDGRNLEKWLLKCLIGFAYGHEMADAHRWEPSAAWVQIVFGLLDFPQSCGLHVGRVPRYSASLTRRSLAVDVLSDQDGAIAGARFNLDGVELMLAMVPTTKPPLEYRPRFLRDRQGGRTLQSIRFDWDGSSDA